LFRDCEVRPALQWPALRYLWDLDEEEAGGEDCEFDDWDDLEYIDDYEFDSYGY
jgi:hypothetical protein